MDQITIKNLEIFANHGVYEEENRLGQLFIVSAVLYVNTWRAGNKDDLDISVDYGSVCKVIADCMEKKTFHLIEAAAEYTAREILRAFPLVHRVELTINKPWAPIGLHLDTAGVTIHRGRHRAYIGVGSNIGDSKTIISMALKHISGIPDIEIKKCSDFIITPPYGVTDQPDFLNGCVEIETLMEPEELLDTLNQIEKIFGRERVIHWGPRTLDLDILFYDGCVINTKRLTVPHPDMANRGFVLEPLNQIAGWYMHPLYHKTVEKLYNEWIRGRKE